MEFKTFQELYLAVGVAGFLVIIGAVAFLIMMKQLIKSLNELTPRLSKLESNDSRFEEVIEGLTEAVKEVATTNRIMAETLNRVDFYNKSLHKQVEKHDEKADKILEEIRKR